MERKTEFELCWATASNRGTYAMNMLFGTAPRRRMISRGKIIGITCNILYIFITASWFRYYTEPEGSFSGEMLRVISGYVSC